MADIIVVGVVVVGVIIIVNTIMIIITSIIIIAICRDWAYEFQCEEIEAPVILIVTNIIVCPMCFGFFKLYAQLRAPWKWVECQKPSVCFYIRP